MLVVLVKMVLVMVVVVMVMVVMVVVVMVLVMVVVMVVMVLVMTVPLGFSRQEYWSGLPFPPQGDLPHPGIEPTISGVSCIDRWILYH